MLRDGQQTGSRQPRGASSVTGAQEGRAQLDVKAAGVARQLLAPILPRGRQHVAGWKQEETRTRFDYLQPPKHLRT